MIPFPVVHSIDVEVTLILILSPYKLPLKKKCEGALLVLLQFVRYNTCMKTVFNGKNCGITFQYLHKVTGAVSFKKDNLPESLS